jgi:anti-sigma regulatory factor (Ser/Thr protein kinase)
MTANHRIQAGRRAGDEESVPLSGSQPASRHADVVDWRVSVPGVPVMVAVARQLVRAALEHSPRVRDVELIISELVTNAINHTPSGGVGSLVTLRIRANTGWARIEISDLGSTSWSTPGSRGVEDERGRGLVIVNSLADRSGHEPADGGHVSWAEVRWDVAPDTAHGAGRST